MDIQNDESDEAIAEKIVTIHSPSNYMRKTSQHKLSVTASQFSVLLM